MAIYCQKCGADLSRPKRRHVCRKESGTKPDKLPGIQLEFWSMRAQCEFDHVGNGK